MRLRIIVVGSLVVACSLTASVQAQTKSPRLIKAEALAAKLMETEHDDVATELKAIDAAAPNLANLSVGELDDLAIRANAMVRALGDRNGNPLTINRVMGHFRTFDAAFKAKRDAATEQRGSRSAGAAASQAETVQVKHPMNGAWEFTHNARGRVQNDVLRINGAALEIFTENGTPTHHSDVVDFQKGENGQSDRFVFVAEYLPNGTSRREELKPGEKDDREVIRVTVTLDQNGRPSGAVMERWEGLEGKEPIQVRITRMPLTADNGMGGGAPSAKPKPKPQTVDLSGRWTLTATTKAGSFAGTTTSSTVSISHKDGALSISGDGAVIWSGTFNEKANSAAGTVSGIANCTLTYSPGAQTLTGDWDYSEGPAYAKFGWRLVRQK